MHSGFRYYFSSLSLLPEVPHGESFKGAEASRGKQREGAEMKEIMGDYQGRGKYLSLL